MKKKAKKGEAEEVIKKSSGVDTKEYSSEEKNPSKSSMDAIENAMKSIQTKFGDESIMMLGEKPKVNVNVVSTGSIGLDAALGVGGLPRGRIIEIFGPESS